MRWLTAMVVSAVGLGCAVVEEPGEAAIAGDAETTGVAFELAGPGGAALIVPVHLNGEGPFDFVLDTGATMTCVDAGLAERLTLPEADGPRGVGVGIGQDPAALRLVRVDSVRVGEATVTEMTGCALDLGQFRAMGLPVEGLLGLNFLRSFRVTLDFPAERLTLE